MISGYQLPPINVNNVNIVNTSAAPVIEGDGLARVIQFTGFKKSIALEPSNSDAEEPVH